VARPKFLRTSIEREGRREDDVYATQQEGRKERDRRAVVDGQFLNANNGGVERGSRE